MVVLSPYQASVGLNGAVARENASIVIREALME